MERMGYPRRWIILGVCILLYGCAMREEIQTHENQIHNLTSRLNTLQQRELEPLQKNLEAHRKEVSQEITDLREKNILTKNDLSTEIKKVQADLVLRLEALQSEVRNMSTGVEEYKDFFKKPPQEQLRELERLRETVALRMKNLEEKGKALEEKDRVFEERIRAAEDRFKGIEDRFKGLDGKVDLVGSKQMDLEKKVTAHEAKEKEPFPPPPPPPPAEVKQPPPPLPGSEDLYKDAHNSFERGDLEGARKKFENFLKQYPNAERSNNAQFWLGETYYLQKDYEKAIVEYEKVIDRYPEGNKVPDATYKMALAFLELGDKKNARNLLKRVIERYPDSKQAGEAKKKLKVLESKEKPRNLQEPKGGK